jgi:hypothetical protein
MPVGHIPQFTPGIVQIPRLPSALCTALVVATHSGPPQHSPVALAVMSDTGCAWRAPPGPGGAGVAFEDPRYDKSAAAKKVPNATMLHRIMTGKNARLTRWPWLPAADDDVAGGAAA